MTSHHHTPADDVVDRAWSLAVDKITKSGVATAFGRDGLGDGVDLAVAQAGTSALLGHVPAFNKLLYNSGYAAATRNTYLTLRRLGMPTDFFWKFEQWDPRRAYGTLDKVVTRILTAMLSREGAGTLKLLSADPVLGRFELRFEDCAECAGLGSHAPMCFFHAGSFAGMLAAMLDLDLDAWEAECASEGAEYCRFIVGLRSDREISVALDRWGDEFRYTFDPGARFAASLAGNSIRRMGDLVDVGYYQMLLASAVLTNMDLIERATGDAGRMVGRELAPIIIERFGNDPELSIEEFYRCLHYASVNVTANGGGFTVEVGQAPEHLAPLPQTAAIPFLAGELGGLLSALSGRALESAETTNHGDLLILRFTPKVG